MAKDGWTFETLLRVLEQRINDLEKLLQERYQTQTKATDAAFVAQQTAMKTAFDAADKAVQAALAAAKEAAAKAEAAAKDRFAAVNEFRGQLADQAGTFMSRAEYYAQHQALVDKLDVLDGRLNALELRLTSRLDLGQGNDEGSSRHAEFRRSSAMLTAQWVAIVIIALGVAASVVVTLIVH